MAQKILAILAEACTVSSCLNAAAAAAGKLASAEIEAFHPTLRPAGASTPPHPDESDAVKGRFQAWLMDHPAIRTPIRWKEIRLGFEEALLQEAAHVDTLVLAFPKSPSASHILHLALSRIAHPFLLVPSLWAERDGHAFAEHALIAWNGSGGAQRALHGAIPWLKAARQVTVLTIDETESSLAAIETVLQQNCIAHEAYKAGPVGRSPGDRIVKLARRLGADLLVMGASSSGGFEDWLLDDATRHGLAKTNLPLLLAR